METFQVKLTKAPKAIWYSKRVGEVFTVRWETDGETLGYRGMPRQYVVLPEGEIVNDLLRPEDVELIP